MKTICISPTYKKKVEKNRLFLVNDNCSKTRILSIIIPTSEHVNNLFFSIEKSDFAYFINSLFGSFVTGKHPFLSRSVSVNSNSETAMSVILDDRRLNKLLLKATLNHKSLKISHCKNHRLKDSVYKNETCLCLFVDSNSITDKSEIKSLLFLAEYIVKVINGIKTYKNIPEPVSDMLSNITTICSEN
ncbi:MAG: hypothetical protein N4A72_03575 [Bacteroidales bacterium]|jgi:hypothetical protein|nr:hypothetical protein [Bacteroidales bacterium]